MRIIGGTYRGMKLLSPKTQDIRPTTDRIKEDIFNIISPYIYNSRFLDLFSGSGAIAIEAISRGCLFADAVERNKDSIELIKKNIAKTKSQEQFQVIAKDAEQFLLSTSNKYDIIFIDPPYQYSKINTIIKTILDREIITPNGIIIAEQGIENTLDENQFDAEIYKTKKYAATILYFIRRKQQLEEETK